jgi:hypothetical protein
MSIGVGGIVSLGGGSGGSSGSTSGIQSINGQTGPTVAITGVNGVVVTAGGNLITIDGAGASGTVGPASSQSGVIGVNGITVEQIGGNFVVNGAALSGLIGTITDVSISAVASYTASFTHLVSGIFNHNFNTRETIVQLYDNSSPPRVIVPDEIISENLNQVGVIFNTPQTGRVVIHAPSGVPTGGVKKYAESFTNLRSVVITHGLNTDDVIVQVKDTSVPPKLIIPDDIEITSANAVSIVFNSITSGRVLVIG